MARSSPRVVDRRLQPGEVWASKAGTGLGATVGTHFSLLWVLVGFVVLTAIICTYAGEQRHLAERQFGDVVVHGQLDTGGVRKKVYSLVLNAPLAARVGAATDSLGLIATGFGVGHVVTNTLINVTTATTPNVGPTTFGIGTAAQCAFDGAGGTDITGAAADADTTAIGSASAVPTALFAFSATNNSVCLRGGSLAAMTAGRIEVLVEVTATPGSPALP